MENHRGPKNPLFKKFQMKAIITILTLSLIASCSSNPVLVTGKKHVIYKGNYAKFAKRAEIKERKRLERLETLQAKN